MQLERVDDADILAVVERHSSWRVMSVMMIDLECAIYRLSGDQVGVSAPVRHTSSFHARQLFCEGGSRAVR